MLVQIPDVLKPEEVVSIRQIFEQSGVVAHLLQRWAEF
jgi:predicted 2-oxoglutarate/Fe(II)-dependent dioxygenase YbiX